MVTKSENIIEMVSDPYSKIDVSILVSSKEFSNFKYLYKTLIRSSPQFHNVEILVKIDEASGAHDYYSLLEQSSFLFKILIYPRLNGIFSNHIFFNSLGEISSGKLIWPLYEDCEIIRGNWYHLLMDIINQKYYKDNIYCITIGMDNGKGPFQICPINIITREWYDIVGCLFGSPNGDRFLYTLAILSGRNIFIREKEFCTHFPQGNRTIGKKDREIIYYPCLHQSLNKLKKEINNQEKGKNRYKITEKEREMLHSIKKRFSKGYKKWLMKIEKEKRLS